MSASADNAARQPTLVVSIWRQLDPLAGARFTVSQAQSWGSAIRCSENGDCDSATAGFVRIDRYDQNALVEGRIDLQFLAGRITGSFHAPWRKQTVLCG